MTYKSILVNLDLDQPIAPAVKFSVALAQEFDAHLIGLCVSDIPPFVLAAEGADFGAELMLREREDLEKRMMEVKSEFEDLTSGRTKRGWRSGITDPTRLAVSVSRAADIVVTGKPQVVSITNAGRYVDIGSLLLQSGRPALMVGDGAGASLPQKAVIAWKDTREARRAVSDAIPLLMRTREVFLVTVDTDAGGTATASLKDVAAFLGHHGIRTHLELIADNDDAGRLSTFVDSMRADLLVSGAYGHSRLREWAFGGVTRYFLDLDPVSRFMSS